jgi:hypothetical protein
MLAASVQLAGSVIVAKEGDVMWLTDYKRHISDIILACTGGSGVT